MVTSRTFGRSGGLGLTPQPARIRTGTSRDLTASARAYPEKRIDSKKGKDIQTQSRTVVFLRLRFEAASPRRINMRTRIALLSLALLVVAGFVQAQSFLGTIRGTVVDPQGAAVSGASVLIIDADT